MDNGFLLEKEQFGATQKPLHVKRSDKNLCERVKFLGGSLPTPLPDYIDDCICVMFGYDGGPEPFNLSDMVGENGKVYVVLNSLDKKDILEDVAKEQASKLGYAKSNVEFLVSENWSCELADESVDVVVANAAFNDISSSNEDKAQEDFIKEALRILKHGGELHLSSLFCTDRRIANEVRDNELVKANHLGGMMYVPDFRRMMVRCGINTIRFMEKRIVDIKPLRKRLPKDIKKQLKQANVEFRTIRIFKLFNLEDGCENYKLHLTYKGEAPHSEQSFRLDDTHNFTTDKDVEVCGNTYAYVADTRFAKYFKCEGDRSHHFGIYDYCRYCGGEGDKVQAALKVKRDCKTCKGGDCSSCK